MKNGYRGIIFKPGFQMALLSVSALVPLERDCCVITAAFITGGPQESGERTFFSSTNN